MPLYSLSTHPRDGLTQVRDQEGLDQASNQPGGFSLAAVILGPVYYFAMKDWLFLCLSALCCLILISIPLLIPLAFMARSRAWKLQTWSSPSEFFSIQKQWDRSALIIGLIGLGLFYFVSQSIFNSLSSTFGTTDVNQILNQVQALST